MLMTPNAQTLKNEFINHDNKAREFLIYVPESYDETKKQPLLFNFHGGGGTASGYLEYVDMRDLAENRQFILVYPQGSQIDSKEGKKNETHWNPDLKSVKFNKSDADDYGFLESMIENISSNYSINLKRVYVCGFSNGADFALSAACYLHNKIAAAASVSGLQSGEIIKSSSPNPPKGIMLVHGTSDYSRPYNEGLKYFGITFNMSVPDIINYWVDVNKLEDDPVKMSFNIEGKDIDHFSYLNSNKKPLIEHYKIINGGHEWYDFEINGESLNEIIWDFLSEHKIKEFGLVITPINAFPFTLTFSSKKDAVYFMEVSDDLTNWLKLREIRGSGNQIEVADSRDDVFKKQYYRMRVEY